MLDAYRYVMQHPVMVAEWITDHLCISLIAIAIEMRNGNEMGSRNEMGSSLLLTLAG